MRRKLKNIGKTLLLLDDSAHQIALGIALGLFVAWTPTVGIQTLIVLPVAWMLRANLVAAMIGTYLSNPLTILPMYWSEFLVGSLIIRQAPTISEFREAIQVSSWSEWTYMMTSLGWRMLLAMCIGGIVLGCLHAIPGYYVTRWLIVRYREPKTPDAG